MGKRSAKQRQAGTLYKLEHERDVWVASADEHGVPHLVPFSLVWDGEHIIVATTPQSRTAKNMRASGLARLAIGETRDVVIIEVHVEPVTVEKADSEIGDRFLNRTGWDPRTATGGDWAFFLMTPVMVQTWLSEEELEGRTIMRNGVWQP